RARNRRGGRRRGRGGDGGGGLGSRGRRLGGGGGRGRRGGRLGGGGRRARGGRRRSDAGAFGDRLRHRELHAVLVHDLAVGEADAVRVGVVDREGDARVGAGRRRDDVERAVPPVDRELDEEEALRRALQDERLHGPGGALAVGVTEALRRAAGPIGLAGRRV